MLSEPGKLIGGLMCPTEKLQSSLIKLGHGSGGKMTSDLIEKLFLPELGNNLLSQLDDATLVNIGEATLAFTTDAYVVSPIFFPGGDIGSLSVHGTINDLAMRGAKPLYLTASFILEEGLPIDELQVIVHSMSKACRKADVALIAGDTKVVNRGAADKLFITTQGVGVVERSPAPAAGRASLGDAIVVSGDLGRHGMAIMCARQGLELETMLESDSAPLHTLVSEMFAAAKDIHCLRDLTRGGLASALNEIAQAATVGIEIDEESIPMHPEVKAACELLGLDPLYVACEGRLVAMAPQDVMPGLVDTMRCNQVARGSSCIGRVINDHPGRVVVKSRIGGNRILDKLSGEQLPRIC